MVFRLFSLALLVPTVGSFLAKEPSRPRSRIDIVSFLFLPRLANQKNAVFPFLESQPVLPGARSAACMSVGCKVVNTHVPSQLLNKARLSS